MDLAAVAAHGPMAVQEVLDLVTGATLTPSSQPSG